MQETVILRLSDEEQGLMAPEMEEIGRLEEALQVVQQRVLRMLMLKCPQYKREPGVEYDPRRGVFVRLEPAQVPNPVEEKEHEDE